jgi:hypothetical protein
LRLRLGISSSLIRYKTPAAVDCIFASLLEIESLSHAGGCGRQKPAPGTGQAIIDEDTRAGSPDRYRLFMPFAMPFRIGR